MNIKSRIPFWDVKSKYSSSYLLNTTSVLYYMSHIYKIIVNLLIFINFNFFLLYFTNVLF